MTNQPLVSVIIPTYNAERFLSQTIESVLAQTCPDWNLIIIDDGSKDGTVALAEAFAAKDGRIRVAAYPNSGVAVARNRGFAESRADIPYLAYLDHDDLWDADFLATLLPALEANPQAVGTHGVARFIDAQGEICEAYGTTAYPVERLAVVNGWIAPLPENAPTTFAAEVFLNCLATPGQAILRRDSVEKAGRFRPDTNPCDDWDLYLRMTQQGDMVFINKIVMGWRQHETNVSKDQERMVRTMRYVRYKLLNQSDLTTERRAMIRTVYRYLRRKDSLKWFESAQECLSRRNLPRAINHARFGTAAYVESVCGHPKPPS